MAKCSVCGKTSSVGNNVSHATNRTKRRWNPNIQRVYVLDSGKRVKRPVCTRCLKSGRVVKAPRTSSTATASTL